MVGRRDVDHSEFHGHLPRGDFQAGRTFDCRKKEARIFADTLQGGRLCLDVGFYVLVSAKDAVSEDGMRAEIAR